MTTMITEVYEAFRDAGVSEDKAAAAAQAVASYEDRFNGVDVRLARIDTKLNMLLALTFLAVIAPAIRDLLSGIN